MKTIFKIPKSETHHIHLDKRYNFNKFIVIICFWLILLTIHSKIEAQIRVPNMMVANDSWGLIDVNKLFGGCMQVDTHADMLKTDVQFLKRGMLFVVYDDDLSTPGPQTKIYIFSPKITSSGKSMWPYDTPFQIPAVKQNLTIALAGLTNSLFPLNISANTDPGNKTNVYFDSATNQFYKYDESTDPGTYVVIIPSASHISVVAQNGITATNVQSALEELHANQTSRFETTVATEGLVDYPIGFELKPNSMVFYNGVLLDYASQWTTGATTSDLKLLVSTSVNDKIKIQK